MSTDDRPRPFPASKLANAETRWAKRWCAVPANSPRGAWYTDVLWAGEKCRTGLKVRLYRVNPNYMTRQPSGKVSFRVTARYVEPSFLMRLIPKRLCY